MAALNDFEPFAAFQRLDRDLDQMISSLEMLRFLRHTGIGDVTEADCFAIINYFDNSEE